MSLCQRSSVLVATGCCDSVTAPDDEVSGVFERRKIFEIEENMSKSTKIRSGAIPFRVRAQRAQAGGSQGPGAGQAAGRRQLPGPRRSSADVGNAQDILLQLYKAPTVSSLLPSKSPKYAAKTTVSSSSVMPLYGWTASGFTLQIQGSIGLHTRSLSVNSAHAPGASLA